jgi:hypothetical protein
MMSFIIFSFMVFTNVCYADLSQKNDLLQENKNRKEMKNDSIKNETTQNVSSATKSVTGSQNSPPEIGNFSLPPSQQPGSLLSFGENIFNKGEMQFFTFGDYLRSAKSYGTEVGAALIYATTDSSSLLISNAYSLRQKEGNFHSSGFGDMALQYEYAFYAAANREFSDQATIVAQTLLPTGTVTKNPATGFGSPSYFLGGTFLRNYVDWLFFTSHGVLVTTSHHGIKVGNEFLYQAGLGRNIAYLSSEWIFNWALEATGQYSEKAKIMGVKSPNSGGNFILLTPSIWFSTKDIIFQFGVAKPIYQHLNGIQNKIHYIILSTFTWTF